MNFNLYSDPVIVAGGLRMMAEHLGSTIDTSTACPERMTEVAGQMRALVTDAVNLSGPDHRDDKIRTRIARLNTAALAVRLGG